MRSTMVSRHLIYKVYTSLVSCQNIRGTNNMEIDYGLASTGTSFANSTRTSPV